jgi:hypothetical protein
LKFSLAGSDLNSGAKPVENIDNQMLNTVRWALRDTLILGFLSSLNNDKNIHQFKNEEELKNASYSLLNLAMLVTSNDVA